MSMQRVPSRQRPDRPRLATGISEASWCAYDRENGEWRFEPAEFKFGPGTDTDTPGDEASTHPPRVAWFDNLLERGILLHSQAVGRERHPLTMLLTGPPGGGKTTFAMELCYRLALPRYDTSSKRFAQGKVSMYMSTESRTDDLHRNAESYGYEDIGKVLFSVPANETSSAVRPAHWARNHGLVALYGKEHPAQASSSQDSGDSLELITKALKTAASYFLQNTDAIRTTEKRIRERLFRQVVDPEIAIFHPEIMVIDSINTFPSNRREELFERYFRLGEDAKDLIILVLDSDPNDPQREYWEYRSDIVIRIDNEFTGNVYNDYYIRTIEIVKARFQSHSWGKHQLKIYRPSIKTMADPGNHTEVIRLRRAHPYRSEGGIFVFPTIHYYLSEFKKLGHTQGPSYADTRPQELNAILGAGDQSDGGFPEGRCTAFMGRRGGHKSHLGYLHILHRLLTDAQKENEPQEGALIVSLRDDEQVTRQTLVSIMSQEFPDVRDLPGALADLEQQNRFEVLYFHPGYITPEEFFHRMFLSVQRLKRRGLGGKERKLTVLFNSLDQLSARFPLCARQEIFIPGIVECLTCEGVTSLFIAVDEPGQPLEQYGLLPMADLILSFTPERFRYEEYISHVERACLQASSGAGTDPGQALNDRAMTLRGRFRDTYRDEIVVEVLRFAGGQRAGARGILELVGKSRPDDTLYERQGLHFARILPSQPSSAGPL